MDKLYIPGDLVSVYVGIKKYIVEVIGTENENEALLYQIKFPNREIQYADNDNIVPIPLTPEILEKNGWKKSKTNDCAYFYYKDGLFLTYTSKDGKFWFDDFDYSSSICVELPYVHSLQHFLFGLGLKSEMEV